MIQRTAVAPLQYVFLAPAAATRGPPRHDSSAVADRALAESELAERNLVAGLRQGDDEAYATLVRVYGPRMLAVARSYLPAQEDAEDVLQSALLLVVRFIHRFEGASRLSTWLHRIVVNSALMRIRSGKRRPEARWSGALLEEDPVSHVADPVGAWRQDTIAQRETQTRLHRAIERLPLDVRAAVRLRDLSGLSIAQTALLLGRSPAAVKTSVHRGRIALRVMLAPPTGSRTFT